MRPVLVPIMILKRSMPQFHIDSFYLAKSTEKPVGILSAPDATQ